MAIREKVQELKDHYRRGGLGDVAVKKYLFEVLESFLEPLRKQRAHFAQDPAEVMNILFKGTEKAREVAAETLSQVRAAMMLDYR